MKVNYLLLPFSILALCHAAAWAESDPVQLWPDLPVMQSSPPANTVPPATVMQSQAVQVYTLPDGRYHAEISYAKQPKHSQTFSFEGTPAEIQQQVQQNKTLPDAQKQVLLQSLNLNNEANPNALVQQLGQSLFNGKDPFDDPFFKNMLNGNNVDLQQFLQGIPQLSGFDDKTVQQLLQQAQSMLQNAPMTSGDPADQIQIPAQPAPPTSNRHIQPVQPNHAAPSNKAILL
jgi:hypothetical protein